MSSNAKTVETFDCTPEQFYNLIIDYEKYPEFLTEVKDCKVVGQKDGHKIVEYKVNVIKSFSYRLKMTEVANKKVSWTLDSGDLFKVSNGYWEIEDAGGKTRATYYVEAQFKVFVPGPIAKALVNVNLPAMMSSYRKRVAQLYK